MYGILNRSGLSNVSEHWGVSVRRGFCLKPDIRKRYKQSNTLRRDPLAARACSNDPTAACSRQACTTCHSCSRHGFPARPDTFVFILAGAVARTRPRREVMDTAEFRVLSETHEDVASRSYSRGT